MAGEWIIGIQETDRLIEHIKKAGQRSEGIINDILRNYAGQEMIEKITPLLPTSGRKWKGKKKAAKTAQPFRQEFGNLSVTVKTKTAYHYLYFPNDGSNTIKHYGNQQFMYRGTEKAVPDIIERCTAKIVEEIGG